MRCRNPFHLCLSSSCSQANNTVQHLSASIRTAPNFLASESFPWLWGILKWLVVTSNDRANSSWFWHESCSSNASNSASSKIFSLPSLCRSSMSKSPFLKRFQLKISVYEPNSRLLILWCRHKSTNVSMGLCWQMPKFIVWHLFYDLFISITTYR